MAPADPSAIVSAPTVGGAIILLAGAAGVAAWSYIKGRLVPAPAKAEAALVGGAIGGNELRLMLEALKKLETIGSQTNDKLDDCRDATKDVERAVRDHASSARMDANNASIALVETHKEARRAAEAVEKLMNERPAAQMPPGRWTTP